MFSRPWFHGTAIPLLYSVEYSKNHHLGDKEKTNQFGQILSTQTINASGDSDIAPNIYSSTRRNNQPTIPFKTDFSTRYVKKVHVNIVNTKGIWKKYHQPILIPRKTKPRDQEQGPTMPLSCMTMHIICCKKVHILWTDWYKSFFFLFFFPLS